MSKQYAVIYRTGDTENFKWKRVFDTYPSFERAQGVTEELERMGYPTLIHPAKLLDSIGLPETFEPTPILGRRGLT